MSETITKSDLAKQLRRIANTEWLAYTDRLALLEAANRLAKADALATPSEEK